jgi:hypothetical protein
VVEQAPAARAVAEVGVPVRLHPARAAAGAAPGARRTPDVRGLSARQAVAWLASLGARARVVGTGAVAAQSARPGAPLPAELSLTLR